MSLAIFLTLLTTVVALAVYYVRKTFSYFKDRGFEFIKPEFPFGNFKGVGTERHFSQMSREFYEQFKNKTPAIGLFLFTNPVVFLIDLDLIKNVFMKDFSNFQNRGLYVNTEADPLSGHLFAIEGAEWKNMRNKLSPTFTSSKMKMMFGTVLNIAEQMVKNLLEITSKSAKIEMNDFIARFSTDVIGNVAFGLDLNCMKDPDSMFFKMGRKVFNPPSSETLKFFFLTTFRKLAKKLNLCIVPKDVSQFFMSSIKETVEYRESNNVVRNDFLNLLLELKNHGKLKDEEGEATDKLTFEELAAQAFVFFLAGYETSSTTMTFTVYELALNQEVQDKLRMEIREMIAKHNGTVTYDAMTEMKYLHMVIDETLRKYPPVSDILRFCSNDYKIPGTKLTIEKDTLVFIPAYAIQNDADIYPNPDKFDPERFSDESKAERHPMAHLPFGAGNRNCIGLRFGYMQMKIGLIHLLLNFKFTPSDRTTIPMKFLPKSQVIAPIDQMWLNVEKI